MPNKVSIIILNWNGLKDTIECLESVQKIDYPNFDIIVVDNGSTDGSVAAIKESFSDITLIQNKENLGYAEGNNVGIRYALNNNSDFIFILNNDTVVDTNILNAFIDAANVYSDAGIFGAKVYYYSEPRKICSIGGGWDKKEKDFVQIGTNIMDNEEFNTIREIDYACGCALFFKKQVAEKIGLLDPKFFLLYEEADWCSRAKKVGFKSLFIPSAKIWHKVSVSLKKEGSPLILYYGTRNHLLWAKRHLFFKERLKVYIKTLDLILGCTLKLKEYSLIKRIYWDIVSIFEPNTKAKLIALLDFLLGNFGICPNYIIHLNKIKKQIQIKCKIKQT